MVVHTANAVTIAHISGATTRSAPVRSTEFDAVRDADATRRSAGILTHRNEMGLRKGRRSYEFRPRSD
jgi:hypothetical protein